MPKATILPQPRARALRKPKGAINRITQDIRGLAQRMISEPGYVDALNRRMKKGTAGAIELLIWHYAYGKPVETTRLIGSTGGAVQIKVVHEHHDDAKVIDAKLVETQELAEPKNPDDWWGSRHRPLKAKADETHPYIEDAPAVPSADTTPPDQLDAGADETEHGS